MNPKDAQKREEVDLASERPLVVMPMSKIVFYVSIVWLLYFLDFMARFGINPLYPLIQKELSLSDPEVGLLGSVVLFGMAILVLPLSYVADRWSRSKLLSLMALVWSACSIISGMAKSLPVLLFARGGLGVGEASFAPTATSLLTSWFKRSQWGRVLGFFNTAVSLGIFVGSIFSGYMAVTYGWRAALIVIGIPGIILGLMALLIPDPKAALQASAGAGREMKLTVKSAAAVVAKNNSMLLLVLFYGIVNMAGISLLSWMPMYFIRVMEMPVPKAATLAGLTAVLGIVGFPLGGYLSDLLVKRDLRYRMWFPAIMALIVAVSFAAALYLKNIPLIFLASFLSTFINPSLNASSQELVPSWYRSVSLGVVIFGMQFIGMLGPYLIGVLSQQFGLMIAMVLMQIAFVICFFGFLIIAALYRNDCRRAREEELGAGVKY
jgi:MFS family permease